MKKKNSFILCILLVLATAFLLPVNAVTYAERHSETVQIPYMNEKPNIDGVVNEEEWGKPTVNLKDDGSLASSFSLRVGNSGKLDDPSATPDAECTIWFRWDETYLYFALTTPDKEPTNTNVGTGGNFFWGDSVFFYLDTRGNWESQGRTPDAPFSGEQLSYLYAQNSDTKENYFGSYQFPTDGIDTFDIKNDGNVTTYEAMIPWDSYIVATSRLEEKVKPGEIFGLAFSLLILDGEPEYEEAGADGFLAWGDVIHGVHDVPYRVGTNALVLSSDYAIAEEPEIETVATESAETETVAPQTGDMSVVVIAVLAVCSTCVALISNKRRIKIRTK